MHCGFCLPTCPTYVLWGEEMDSPRGRIYLMKAGLEGRTAMTPAFVGHFDACLGCMACVTSCPSGVQYAPLIEATRAQIERRHPRSLADRLFRGAIFALFPYPAPAAPGAAAAGDAATDDRNRGDRQSASADIVLSGLRGLGGSFRTSTSLLARVARDAVAGAAGDAGVAVRVDRRRGRRPSDATRLTVGLLTGCVQRLVFPHVNAATVRVLAAEGCDVVAPPEQGCCGALALHAGRLDEARAFARRDDRRPSSAPASSASRSTPPAADRR